MAIRRRRLQWLFFFSSAATAVVLLGIGLVALRAIAVSHRAATDAARADVKALEDAGELQGLLYQKGFVAEYFLTGDDRWLVELDKVRPAFEAWLAGITRDASTLETGQATAELVAEYGRYDADRVRAIASYRAGDRDGAIRELVAGTDRAARLRDLATHLIALRRGEVNERLAQADRAWHRSLVGLASASLLAVLGAAIVGFLLARRVARPLYQLILHAESAAGGARVEVSSSGDDEIGALSEHVTRLAREIETSSSALAEQRARLTQAEKMSALGEMATAVAHEVLNPLTGVKTAMQLLSRNHDDRDVVETARAVDDEIRRVEQMARRLMSFARPVAPSLRWCDVREVLPRVLQAARAEAEAHHVRIEPRINGVHTVYADPDLLTQILVNLTVNACQAANPAEVAEGTVAGTVAIGLKRDGTWTVIEVSDDGTGLAPELRGRLFAPFATTREGGHGLGLAISQGIALAHGGRIEARANVPRGTTFAVFLPGLPGGHA